MPISKPNIDELPSLKCLKLCTAAALLLAVALAVVVVLPAERGIDLTGLGDRLHLTRMGQIKVAMAEDEAPLTGRPQAQREISVNLAPSQGIEIKLEMKKAYVVDYSWQTDGAALYHDTHGDPYVNENIYVSYSKAEATQQDSGSIRAVYGGFHGWYWVNNNDSPVTVQLTVSGEFLDLVSK